MVPDQKMIQETIQQCVRHGVISVIDVQRAFPEGVEIPRRFNAVIEAEVQSLYPDAQYQGGGIFVLKGAK